MFHRTAFDQVALGYIWVVGDHTICEAKPELHIRVGFGGAQEDDVSKALARAMHAGDSVGVVVDAADMSEEVHLAVEERTTFQ